MKKKNVELKRLFLDKDVVTLLSKNQENQIVGAGTINQTFPCLCREESKVVSCYPSECIQNSCQPTVCA